MRFQPEMELVFRLFYFARSIAVDVPSPGNTYQNLQYFDSGLEGNHDGRGNPVRMGNEGTILRPSQKAIHLALSVLLPWGWERVRYWRTNSSLNTRWNPGEESAAANLFSRTWWTRDRVFRFVEVTVQLASLINFLVFLAQGRYRSLIDRLAGTCLLYQDLRAKRVISFEFLNRQLVWEGFTDFFLFVWPLVSHPRLRRSVSRVWQRLLQFNRRREPIVTRDPSALIQCPVCASLSPVMPHIALPCSCTFCYLCLYSVRNGNQECPRCLQNVVESRRIL